MEPVEDFEAAPPSGEVVARLVASHRDFLTFLEARVPSRAIAEEILQAAFVRTLEKGGTIRENESAVAWFFRLLRNAIVDHYRRSASETRALDQQAAGGDMISKVEFENAVCTCMSTLLPNLKPDYAEMIERVDLREVPLATVAAELGITTNNATVRLHRARQALKRQLERSCGTCATHGCLDCTCGDHRGQAASRGTKGNT